MSFKYPKFENDFMTKRPNVKFIKLAEKDMPLPYTSQ